MPKSPTVRSLRFDDPERIVRVFGGSTDDLHAWTAVVGSEPLCGLLAERAGEPVAAMLGAIGRSAYHVLEMRAAGAHADAGVAALVGHLRAQLPGLALELRTADEAVGRLVERHGFEPIRDELRYVRAIERRRASRAVAEFQFRTYSEAGKSAMTSALARVMGDDPFFRRRHMDPLDALDEMIESATDGGMLDASLWYLAERDHALAGVVLGRCDARTRVGSFAYIGLVPELRGKGLGTRLHAAGLDLLAAAGATTYRDATAHENVAMQRVFKRNGCARSGAARVWRQDTPAPPASFESLAHLSEWLGSGGHLVKDAGVGPWIRFLWRSGYQRRPLEVGWLADARITQVMHRFDLQVPPHGTVSVARLISELNRALNFPGFFLDETTGSGGFRQSIIQNRDGSVDARQLLTACSLAVNTAEAYEPTIAGLCDACRKPPLLRRVPIGLPGRPAGG